MAIGNYALLVTLSNSYPGFGGIDDYIYSVGNIVNLITIDPTLNNYPLPVGLVLEDNSAGTIQITQSINGNV